MGWKIVKELVNQGLGTNSNIGTVKKMRSNSKTKRDHIVYKKLLSSKSEHD